MCCWDFERGIGLLQLGRLTQHCSNSGTWRENSRCAQNLQLLPAQQNPLPCCKGKFSNDGQSVWGVWNSNLTRSLAKSCGNNVTHHSFRYSTAFLTFHLQTSLDTTRDRGNYHAERFTPVFHIFLRLEWVLLYWHLLSVCRIISTRALPHWPNQIWFKPTSAGAWSANVAV